MVIPAHINYKEKMVILGTSITQHDLDLNKESINKQMITPYYDGQWKIGKFDKQQERKDK